MRLSEGCFTPKPFMYLNAPRRPVQSLLIQKIVWVALQAIGVLAAVYILFLPLKLSVKAAIYTGCFVMLLRHIIDIFYMRSQNHSFRSEEKQDKSEKKLSSRSSNESSDFVEMISFSSGYSPLAEENNQEWVEEEGEADHEESSYLPRSLLEEFDEASTSGGESE